METILLEKVKALLSELKENLKNIGTKYSKTEHKIGKWIDGKDIFEITKVATNLSIDTGYKIEDILDTTNINVINMFGFCETISGSGVNRVLIGNDLYSSGSAKAIGTRIANNTHGVAIYNKSGMTITAYYITIQYIKTEV